RRSFYPHGWRGGSPRNLRPVGSNGRLLLAEIALK
ncbi:hypothetical protein ACQSGF_11090, partial [Klebsiella pneumoniae]